MNMDKKDYKLGEILVKKGLISLEQLQEALDEQQETKEFLGSILLKNNKINEGDLARALSEKYKIPFTAIEYIDWAFVDKFSPSLILDYKCFPIKEEGSSIVMAITNPLDAWAIKMAEEATKSYSLKLVLVTSENMKEAIQRFQEHKSGKYR